jgi:GNAT superfamily N-acetyltransferase
MRDLSLDLPLNLPGPAKARHGFLPSNASSADRITAAARNHTAWFTATALASDREVQRHDGVLFTGPPGGDIAFPRLTTTTANQTLDAILDYYRRHRHHRQQGAENGSENGPQSSIGVWATLPTRPRDLGARLLARGFEWGWQPRWMALNLADTRLDFTVPERLHIAVTDDPDWPDCQVSDLPFFQPADRSKLRCMSAQKPRRTWLFAASLEGQVVGQAVLFLTTGRYGVAGIYNVGVVPSARRQGIGRAVTAAACQYGRALGAQHALLNAATHIYDRLGFETLGLGQSWWLHDSLLAAPVPTPDQIRFVEALGRGRLSELAELAALPPSALPEDLGARLPCGMTPMGVAVAMRQERSVRWLMRRGIVPTLVQCWDLGWRASVESQLAANPDLVNDLSVAGLRTPLHHAIERNDHDLFHLLLKARPDLTVKDKEYNGTALGWALHLGRAELIRELEGRLPAQEQDSRPV